MYINKYDEPVNRTDSIENVFEEIITMQKKNKMYSFAESLSNTYNSYTELLNKKKEPKAITDTCVPFSKKLFLTSTGKILPCENVNHKFALGYVKDRKIDLNTNEIAKEYNNYFSKMVKSCSTCYISNNCPQCVFYLNINDSKPKCPSRIDNYQEYAKILSEEIQFIENVPKIYVQHMKK